MQEIYILLFSSKTGADRVVLSFKPKLMRN